MSHGWYVGPLPNNTPQQSFIQYMVFWGWPFFYPPSPYYGEECFESSMWTRDLNLEDNMPISINLLFRQPQGTSKCSVRCHPLSIVAITNNNDDSVKCCRAPRCSFGLKLLSLPLWCSGRWSNTDWNENTSARITAPKMTHRRRRLWLSSFLE